MWGGGKHGGKRVWVWGCGGMQVCACACVCVHVGFTHQCVHNGVVCPLLHAQWCDFLPSYMHNGVVCPLLPGVPIRTLAPSSCSSATSSAGLLCMGGLWVWGGVLHECMSGCMCLHMYAHQHMPPSPQQAPAPITTTTGNIVIIPPPHQ